MIKQICIIGNSHLGALNGGLKMMDPNGTEVIFWGAPGRLFPKIRYSQGVLRSSDREYAHIISGGRHRDLPLDRYETLIFYACHVEITPLLKRVLNGPLGSSETSSQFFLEAFGVELDQWWQNLTFPKIMGQIAADFPEKRMMMFAHPHWSARSGAIEQRLRARQAVRLVNDFIRQKCTLLGIQYIEQPEETVADDIYTDDKWCKGSIMHSSGENHPETDTIHMNANYGRIIMERLLGSTTPESI
ncbi:hypothetical protein [Sphingobium ummariense]